MRDPTKLTPKMVEVLERLCFGESNKEIGKTLHLSDLTIQRHVLRICQRLDAKNRTHAVALYLAPQKIKK